MMSLRASLNPSHRREGSGVLRKACFALARNPNYNSDERGDEDKKIECRFHVVSLHHHYERV